MKMYASVDLAAHLTLIFMLRCVHVSERTHPTRGSSASALALISLGGSGADINRPRPAAGLDDGGEGGVEVGGGRGEF